MLWIVGAGASFDDMYSELKIGAVFGFEKGVIRGCSRILYKFACSESGRFARTEAIRTDGSLQFFSWDSNLETNISNLPILASFFFPAC